MQMVSKKEEDFKKISIPKSSLFSRLFLKFPIEMIFLFISPLLY